MRRKNILLIAIVIVGSAALVWRRGAANMQQDGPPFRIARETTYAVGPLDDAGYVDYHKYLDQTYGEGATPENNVLVSLLPYFPPDAIAEESREEFFKRLGVRAPLAADPVFRSWLDVAEELGFERLDQGKFPGHFREQITAAMGKTWTGQDYPELAHWLDEQRVVFDTAVAASKRGRLFLPFVPSREETLLALHPVDVEQLLRDIFQGLIVRAMLRAGKGDLPGAYHDLDACYRWAELEGQVPAMTSFLGSAVRWHVVLRAEAALLSLDCQTPETLRERLRFVSRLEIEDRLPQIVMYSRLAHLDTITQVARRGPDALQDATDESLRQNLVKAWTQQSIDWNTILADTNQRHDQFLAAVELPDYAARMEAVDAAYESIGDFQEAVGKKPLVLDLLSGRAGVTRRMQATLLNLIPFLPMALVVEQQARVQLDLTRVAIAAEVYRREQGSSAPSLHDLEPLLDGVPLDRFTGKPLFYKQSADDALIYSAGRNGRDDGGDEESDLVVRLRR